jgi:hypothetical protein
LGIVAVVDALQPAPGTRYLIGVQVFFYQFVAVVVVVFGYVLAQATDGGQEIAAAACMLVGVLDAEGAPGLSLFLMPRCTLMRQETCFSNILSISVQANTWPSEGKNKGNHFSN